MKLLIGVSFMGISAMLAAIPALCAIPTAADLAAAREWSARNLVRAQKASGTTDTEARQPGITILTNYGAVQRNARDGRPLRIADQTYVYGLFCHAMSKLLVRLPAPGNSFSAIVGVDTNGEYSGGSICFSVAVGDREIARSPVKHRNEPGTEMVADLDGAREFYLVVDNGGDNINSDQAAWAHAAVTLEDGRKLRIGDMPITNGTPPVRLLNAPPFSFTYDGKPSDALIGRWRYRQSRRSLDRGKTRIAQEYTDPGTGLRVKCIVTEYSDFPTVEWILYIKNTGKMDTPIISDVMPLDLRLTYPGRPYLLHHFVGSICGPNDYQPLETSLTPHTSRYIATDGGRPTNGNMPYFNIEGLGTGVIAVIGWPGQWSARFVSDANGDIRVVGGQENTRFLLHPGEEVRTPMAVVQFYHGDWVTGQNIWRRWMLEHNTPRPWGKPLQPMASACNGNHYPGIITNASEEMRFLRRYKEEGIKLDYWWQDAGWYPCDPIGWAKTGTWEVEPSRWPNGIREVSDYCRGSGTKTIVWFEPERVYENTWLWDRHPEWILKAGTNQGLLNLGESECRKWLADHIDKVMTEQGIDLYRQDFNIDPLPYWSQNDTDDRKGITEMHYVSGYLAYWDDLIRRRRGMLIDSCASGGRRNDLETLRRAVPLHRSDYTFEPVGEQCHTYGISFWMPFNGTGFLTVDKYLIRSQMSPEFTLGVDTRRTDLDYGLLRELTSQWRGVAPCYFGDYYPLTPYSLENNTWMAWQFDRPEMSRGFVQAFRRAGCPEPSITLRLRGLDPNVAYAITDLDGGREWRSTGRELMSKGLRVESSEVPSALIFTYHAVK